MTLPLAFLRRDFLIFASYRLSAAWQVIAVILMVGVVYSAGTVIGERSDLISEQDGSYVAFILVGLAFMDVLLQGLGALPRAISENQRAGTLEPMLLAPITNFSLLISFWLFRFLIALFRMFVLLVCGFAVLGYWSSADPVTVIAIMIPAELTFFAIGAFSAAFVVLLKQGDPVRYAYMGITAILGGAFFPVDALPAWLQPLTILVPLTHALNGVRDGLDGASVDQVALELGVLTAMSAVALPLGLLCFSWAVRRAKEEGALGEY